MRPQARWLPAAAAGLVAILPFVVAFAFIHQSYDDAGFLLELEARGLPGSQAFWYRTFSGRFTSNAIVSVLSATIHHVWLYRIVCLAVLALLAWAIHRVLRASLGLTPLPAAALASLALGTFLCMTPSAAEGLYWLTGTATYTLGTAFLLLAVAGTLAPDGGRRHVAVTAAWIVLAVGMNEVALLLANGWLGLAIVQRLTVHRRVERRFVVWMAAALLAAVASLAAPGNWNRLDFSREVATQSVSLGGALVMAARELAMASYYLLHVSPLLFLLLAGILLLGHRDEPPGRHAWWRELLVLPAFAPVFFGVLAFFIFAQGARPIPRVLNPVYLSMILVTLVVAVRTARMLDGVRTAPKLMLALVLVGYLSAAMRAGSGARMAYAEMLGGQWSRFDREVRARGELARRQPGRDVVVPPIATRPNTIFVFDIAPNPAERHNVLYAWFYGVRTIAVSRPSR